MSTPRQGGPYRAQVPGHPMPYGGPFPAGLDAVELPRVPRPSILILALVLQLFSAVPFVLVGGVLADGVDGLADADARTVGGLVIAVGLVFGGLAVIAFAGWNWARVLLGLMTGPIAVVLVVTLVNGASDISDTPGSRTIVGIVLVTAVIGAVLMFLPDCAHYFANPRPPRPASRRTPGRL